MLRATLLLLFGLTLVVAGSPVSAQQETYINDHFERLDRSKEPWQIHFKPRRGGERARPVHADCKVDLGDGKLRSREALSKLKRGERIRVTLHAEERKGCKMIRKIE
jgi:hypothetical protein